MKDRIFKVMIILILVVGICIFMYPTVGNIINKITARTTISGYSEAVENMDDEKINKKWLEAEEYNRILAGQAPRNILPEGMEPKDCPEYISVNSVLGFISIPQINVNLPIFSGDSNEALMKGVWLLDNTSIPIGGESTHSVLSGHRGLPSATLFSNLDKLKEGDVFFISILDEKLSYKIDSIKTVLPSEVEDIEIIEGEDYVTLVTCTPYGINTHRLLVRGTRFESTDTPLNTEYRGETTVIIPTFNLVIGATAIFSVIALLLIFKKSRKKKSTVSDRRYFD